MNRDKRLVKMKRKMRTMIYSGATLEEAVAELEDDEGLVFEAIQAPHFKRSMVVPLYDSGLDPMDIHKRTSLPIEMITKILKGRPRNKHILSQPIGGHVLDQLRWRSNGPRPAKHGDLYDEKKSRPKAAGHRPDRSFLYSEEFTDHLVDGDLGEGFTDEWFTKAIDIAMMIGGFKRRIVASNSVKEGIRRYNKDKCGYLDSMKKTM